MMNLLWLQGECCGGETVSLLNADQLNFFTFLDKFGVNLLWHPFFSAESDKGFLEVAESLINGEKKLDILVVEGAVCRGPEGSGRYHIFCGAPFKDWVVKFAQIADYVVAVGTCSCFGGIPASGENLLEMTGLQFLREKRGGLLGEDFKSRSGLPVVNIAGCPAHPEWILESFLFIIKREIKEDALDEFQRPEIFYQKLAHHACPRNEYYEFKASAEVYSQQGCLFENLGCKGTQCESDCNERLWLVRTGSCTRGGFPCISCTSPRFPDDFLPFFRTLKIGNIPTTLPLDVPKAWYVGISGLAKLACPQRLLANATSFKPVKSTFLKNTKKIGGK